MGGKCRFMMPIPKYVAGLNRRKVTKYCEYPGCGMEFMGYKMAKYCDTHRGSESLDMLRKRGRKAKIARSNQVWMDTLIKINARGMEGQVVFRECQTCQQQYSFVLHKDVSSYPRHCHDHMNEHKRNLYHHLKAQSMSVNQFARVPFLALQGP